MPPWTRLTRGTHSPCAAAGRSAADVGRRARGRGGQSLRPGLRRTASPCARPATTSSACRKAWRGCYRERFGLPVWVMGHSNGGFSIAEFVKHLKERNREDLVAGLIFSAARTSSSFGDGPFPWPALFVVSAEDGCTGTSAEGNERLYQRFRERNAAPTEFVQVRSAQPEGADPPVRDAHVPSGRRRGCEDPGRLHCPPHTGARRCALTGPTRPIARLAMAECGNSGFPRSDQDAGHPAEAHRPAFPPGRVQRT